MPSLSSALRSPGLGLVLAVVLAGAAACGPPPDAVTPPAPTVAPTATAAPTTTPTAAPTVAPAIAPSIAPTAPPGPPVGKPLGASKYLDELKQIGIDLKKAPELEKLAPAQKKRLMPLFKKALGYEQCTGCHASDGDFTTVTRNMKVTRGMWSHFVAALRDDKGGQLFCDSCHAGTAKILNRADEEAVSKYMKENYVTRLARADGKENGCDACHGPYHELKVVEKLWGIAAK